MLPALARCCLHLHMPARRQLYHDTFDWMTINSRDFNLWSCHSDATLATVHSLLSHVESAREDFQAVPMFSSCTSGSDPSSSDIFWAKMVKGPCTGRPYHLRCLHLGDDNWSNLVWLVTFLKALSILKLHCKWDLWHSTPTVWRTFLSSPEANLKSSQILKAWGCTASALFQAFWILSAWCIQTQPVQL